jgi:hypothetical protein
MYQAVRQNPDGFFFVSMSGVVLLDRTEQGGKRVGLTPPSAAPTRPPRHRSNAERNKNKSLFFNELDRLFERARGPGTPFADSPSSADKCLANQPKP